MKPALVLPLAFLLGTPALAQDQPVVPAQPGAPAIQSPDQMRQQGQQGQPDQGQMATQAMSAADFVAFAASGDLLEVQSSQFVHPAMTDEDLKTLAQHIMDDHSAATTELREILAKKGEEPPAPALLPRHADMLATLQQTPGDTLMRAYLDLQVQAHTEAIAQFSSYAQTGDDPELRDFAARALPKLQEHLESVQQISQRLS